MFKLYRHAFVPNSFLNINFFLPKFSLICLQYILEIPRKKAKFLKLFRQFREREQWYINLKQIISKNENIITILNLCTVPKKKKSKICFLTVSNFYLTRYRLYFRYHLICLTKWRIIFLCRRRFLLNFTARSSSTHRVK